MDHQARSVPKVAAMQATPLKSAMIGLALSFMLGLAAMLALSQAVYAQAGAVPPPIGVIKRALYNYSAQRLHRKFANRSD